MRHGFISKITLIVIALIALTAAPLEAQNNKKSNELKNRISNLQTQLKNDEKNLSQLKKQKASKEAEVRNLARQLDISQELLEANEQSRDELQTELTHTDSIVSATQAQLEIHRRKLTETIRETYRNYRNNSYLSFVLSSGSFREMAERIALLRQLSKARIDALAEIETLESNLLAQRAELERQKQSLDDAQKSILTEKNRLQRIQNETKNAIKQLTEKEKQTLKNKAENEKRLASAQKEFEKLAKGNTVGSNLASGSKMKNPVSGGRIEKVTNKKYYIYGKHGSCAAAVWDGLVTEVRYIEDERRYDVHIAHGEKKLTSYSNLSKVFVKKGDKVKVNQNIGVLGASIDPSTGDVHYRTLLLTNYPISF